MSQQDLVNGIKDAPQTFSSWDKCMAKTYCKWPVIVIIIVGALIAISIIWCVARCLCCGAECACCCFKCCAGCCGSGRRKDPDRTAGVLPNSYNTPYQSHPAPSYTPGGGLRSNNDAYEPPQYARFDTPSSKPVNEDALPPMPSWSDAKSHRIEDDSHEDVEMKPLAPNGEYVAAAAPIASPAGRSPVQSPSENGYFTGQQPHQNPYGGGYHAGPYRPQNSRQNTNQSGYGSGHGFRQDASYQNNNAYGQESGVYHNQQQYGGDYSNQNQGYESGQYARQASPYQPPRSPYHGNDDAGYGYQQSPVQPVQQSGWHTRQPMNNGWREV
ncbi:hypothetical protein EJ05DRAFT_506155 [Pseudovirgaria hyperparasitica]|uniref:Fibroin-3 related protein n=1 Tax=Pseudovirgaria hyperparasitica TaxID=470096 RepID=A0A6A6WJI2_9PEZI|nr:uncharacterized protein EJ05DRAFT_506155 [Pseudovirgaria hyperparasitica]KAF2762424.1 hypothetical protein EJ05DRAFT_506155 [Pseudovirgaria hyperparasitica]